MTDVTPVDTKWIRLVQNSSYGNRLYSKAVAHPTVRVYAQVQLIELDKFTYAKQVIIRKADTFVLLTAISNGNNHFRWIGPTSPAL